MYLDLIGKNPMLKKPILMVLGLFVEDQQLSRAAAEKAACNAWKDSYSQSPATTVDILVRNHALDETIFVDGEVYEGSMSELVLSPDVDDDAKVETVLALTEAGARLYDRYQPDVTLRELLSEKPRYLEQFEIVLDLCSAEAGRSRDELDEALEATPALAVGKDTGQAKVYPQYFLDALETAGGIEWNGAWRTTSAGKACLEGIRAAK